MQASILPPKSPKKASPKSPLKLPVRAGAGAGASTSPHRHLPGPPGGFPVSELWGDCVIQGNLDEKDEDKVLISKALTCGHLICAFDLDNIRKPICPVCHRDLDGPLVTDTVLANARSRELADAQEEKLRAKIIAALHGVEEIDKETLYDMPVEDLIKLGVKYYGSNILLEDVEQRFLRNIIGAGGGSPIGGQSPSQGAGAGGSFILDLGQPIDEFPPASFGEVDFGGTFGEPRSMSPNSRLAIEVVERASKPAGSSPLSMAMMEAIARSQRDMVRSSPPKLSPGTLAAIAAIDTRYQGLSGLSPRKGLPLPGARAASPLPLPSARSPPRGAASPLPLPSARSPPRGAGVLPLPSVRSPPRGAGVLPLPASPARGSDSILPPASPSRGALPASPPRSAGSILPPSAASPRRSLAPLRVRPSAAQSILPPSAAPSRLTQEQLREQRLAYYGPRVGGGSILPPKSPARGLLPGVVTPAYLPQTPLSPLRAPGSILPPASTPFSPLRGAGSILPPARR
ncbi:Hypothetical protein POVN_LOCUS26 [uncultured virus]|nr:Hypothetical protein POVN_LOCUS26 [uncultured virus]